MTAIHDNVATPVAVAPQHASQKAKPIRVLTNVDLEEREQVLDLGFSVQMVDTASVCTLSGNGLDVDIVVLDRSVLDASSFEAMAQFFTLGSNVPILFINGSASLATRAGDGADKVEDPSVANSMINALKLAAAFARLNRPATDKEGLICGKLVLQDSRGFWNGTDLDLTIGEYRIIELLRSRPGRYVSYRAIYDRLRHKDFVAGLGPNGYRVNVRSAVKRIRNKFRAVDSKFREIECYRAFGYRWRKLD
jgi:two-component system, OmpR family, response regulator ChvI